jgi:hypothetical protein
VLDFGTPLCQADHCGLEILWSPFRKSASTSRCLVAFFFLIVLPGIARPQEYSTSQSRQGDPYTISVCVDMAVLHATVRNIHKDDEITLMT